MVNTDKAILEKIAHRQKEAMLNKKTHFNAADRKKQFHLCLGLLAIVISVLFVLLNALVQFADIFGDAQWLSWANMCLAFLAFILYNIRALLKYGLIVHGHEKIAADYLDLFKAYRRLQAGFQDKAIDITQLQTGFTTLSQKQVEIDEKAQAFPTTKIDSDLTQKGLKNNEEEYSKTNKDSALLTELEGQNTEGAVIEKRKHLYAAKRKAKLDSILEKSVMIITFLVVITLSLEAIFLTAAEVLRWSAVFGVLIAMVLFSIRAQMNLIPIIEGHKLMADEFSTLSQQYLSLKSEYQAHTIQSSALYQQLETLSDQHNWNNRKGHAFPTNVGDYKKKWNTVPLLGCFYTFVILLIRKFKT